VGELESSFSKLLGRAATDSECQDLYRVKDALGLRPNDAIWMVLMALQDYESRYKRFPGLISEAADATLTKFKLAADATILASTASANAVLMKSVADAVDSVAHNTVKKQMWKWATGCIATSFACVAVFGWYMHNMGKETGIGIGYNDAKDAVAAASWANTPQGKAAYLLATAGSIDALSQCNQPGWILRKNECFPQSSSDKKLYGWKVKP
jgi:hypothetical protein